jgi:cell division protein FtsN
MTGLFIGLVIGLIAAAGIAWYFNNHTPSFKTLAEPKVTPKNPDQNTDIDAPPHQTVKSEEEPEPEPIPAPTTKHPSNTTKPRVDYTFYGILPGDKTAKQALPTLHPPESKDIWWLQVAAIKSPADADRLKAKLTLLGLHVAMQKIDNSGTTLYRIRTGPYKREDDALGDLDTLAANDFEPRLLKETAQSASPQ